MNFYTYILESESSGMLYIGQTSDLKERLTRHNTGNSRFTKSKGPWKMIFSIKLESRSEAILLEKKLKGLKNRDRIKKWIESQSSK
jgi:putative endonuclease